MWRRGGYIKDFSHRLGYLPSIKKDSKRIRIWIQAVSVGEILAIGPLIERLKKEPRVDIILTTTTSTGYAEARNRYSQQTIVIGIFPIDFWLFSRKAWKRLSPDAIIQTESELWPEHLHQAKEYKTPIFLINARISDRSFSRYQKLHFIARRLFGKIDHIFASSDLDRNRIITLGAKEEQVTNTGSIKFDVSVGIELSKDERTQLRADLGFKPSKTTPIAPFIIVGASTWPGEEALLLEAQKALIDQGVDCRVLLVPRHAERAPEIIQLLTAQSLSWHQRSIDSTVQNESDFKIYLADTTGELSQLIQAGDLAFIGKSLEPHRGGQTPIESAGLGLPILMGPHMENFRQVTASLVQSEAAIQIENSSTLKRAIIDLHTTPATRATMAEAGKKWHQSNRGSSDQISAAILQVLTEIKRGS